MSCRPAILAAWSVACLICSAAAPAPPAWPPKAAQSAIHMIGQGHIDPVWLWPMHEGISVVHSTFRSALDRMKETPGFAFTASSAQFYTWVARPRLAERRPVAPGRRERRDHRAPVGPGGGGSE